MRLCTGGKAVTSLCSFLSEIYMLRFVCVVLACLLSVGSTSVAQAQVDLDVRINDVRVGWSKGNEDYFKLGYWVPVAVDVEVLDQDFVGQLYIETQDGDGSRTRYVLPETPGVFVSRSEKVRTFVSYIKIGDASATVTAILRGRYGTRDVERRFVYPDQRQPFVPVYPLALNKHLVVGIGIPQGIDFSYTTEEGQADLYSTPVRVAFQTDLGRLPEHWFGYESVDVVILPTGGTWQGSIAQRLMLDSRRRAALETWVRLGGHLVVSVSSNAAMVANRNSFPLESLLPADVDPDGTVRVERMAGFREMVLRLPAERRVSKDEVASLGPIEMARLKPRPFSRTRATEPGPGLPSIVQAPYGLGKVTLIAVDVDQEPFGSWLSNRDFWVALLDLRTPGSDAGTNVQTNAPWNYFESQDLATRLASDLEQFGGVRIVPFWWVALFILIYIAVVGPLDYFVLKHLMRRLTGAERMEWTWITFPSIVLIVSVGSYFLAYHLKGDELRINKLDLLDIDLDPRSQRVYGSTLFSLFSPRLQHYDLSLESVGFGTDETNVLSWMGRPGYGARSLGRTGAGGSLFQRTYEFREDARLLYGVPVHVWASKNFHARWEAPLAKGQTPVKYDFRVDQKQLQGSITNLLSEDLLSAQLIFGDRVLDLGRIKAGETVTLSREWREFGGSIQGSTLGNWVGYANNLQRMLFFRQQPRSTNESNDYLGYLDQSWRLDFPTQAILVARLDDRLGGVAEINDTQRLGTRFRVFEPELRGRAEQKVLIRMFLPVQRGN
ncbi:MAG: hypothetical protein NZM31_02270 [Gemmatales bacterium]|nr:hypothetical protein [Gemmatales bacterium]MDW8385823.1 hypothetical protein [Gemmatales bacterium]